MQIDNKLEHFVRLIRRCMVSLFATPALESIDVRVEADEEEQGGKQRTEIGNELKAISEEVL